MQFHEDGTIPDQTGNVVFVSGSNLCGRHGKGAAKVAHRLFGATMGVGIGRDNQSYHIPTKPCNVWLRLSVGEIHKHIRDFVRYTKENPNDFFFITRIGCGLAGYQDSDMAPLFHGLGDNCSVVESWKQFLV